MYHLLKMPVATYTRLLDLQKLIIRRGLGNIPQKYSFGMSEKKHPWSVMNVLTVAIGYLYDELRKEK